MTKKDEAPEAITMMIHEVAIDMRVCFTMKIAAPSDVSIGKVEHSAEEIANDYIMVADWFNTYGADVPTCDSADVEESAEGIVDGDVNFVLDARGDVDRKRGRK